MRRGGAEVGLAEMGDWAGATCKCHPPKLFHWRSALIWSSQFRPRKESLIGAGDFAESDAAYSVGRCALCCRFIKRLRFERRDAEPRGLLNTVIALDEGAATETG